MGNIAVFSLPVNYCLSLCKHHSLQGVLRHLSKCQKYLERLLHHFSAVSTVDVGKAAELSLSTEIFCWMSTCNCSEEGTERERKEKISQNCIFPGSWPLASNNGFACVFFHRLHAVGQTVKWLCHIISALLRFTVCDPSKELYSLCLCGIFFVQRGDF